MRSSARRRECKGSSSSASTTGSKANSACRSKTWARYLNGAVTFKVALANGALDVRLDDVTVKGKPLPGMLSSEFKKQNFAQNFQNDPQTATNIAKFESVQITNGTVILRSKAATP